jgi:hypothetical protein
MGNTFRYTLNQFSGKPTIAIMTIGGYQPSRLVYSRRSPTIDEIRAHAFDSILSGASGFFMYPFSKSGPDNGEFYIEDPYSAGLYADIKNFADDIINHSEIFFLPFATDINVTTSNESIKCSIWEGEKKHYMVCVNLAQVHSEYFDVPSGDEVYRPNAFVRSTDNKDFPNLTAYNARYTKYTSYILNKSLVEIQDINTGNTNIDYNINETLIYINQAPLGANISIAIYADNLRDYGADTRIYLAENLSLPSSGWFSHRINPSVVLEHTKNYYLFLKVDSDRINITSWDVRNGLRVKDGRPDVPGY